MFPGSSLPRALTTWAVRAIAGMSLFALACGLGKKPDATQPTDPAGQTATETLHRLTTSLARESNLTRPTVEVMAIRLNALFPGMNPDARTGPARALASQLRDLQLRRGEYSRVLTAGGMRASGIANQAEFQQLISGLCSDPSASQGILSEDLSSVLLSHGETLPTDPALRLALGVARKAWLYPYTVESMEVQTLATLYRRALVAPGGNGEGARKLVCQAALFSPQFWIGNPGQLDIVRKLSLSLAHEIPDFRDFERIRTGQLTLSAYLERIQREKREQYLAAIVTWHKEWIQWDDTPDLDFFRVGEGFLEPRSRKGVARHAITESYPSALTTHEVTLKTREIRGVGVVPVIENAYTEYSNPPFITDSEQCDPEAQAFDPRTSRVEWWLSPIPVREPAGVRTSHVFASWRKIADTSSPTSTVDLAQISYNRLVGPEYQTPVRTVAGVEVGPRTVGDLVDGKGVSRLRVIRYGLDGRPQTGYSPVRLWWSGQSVYVCNNLLRFLTACSFQPNSADVMETMTRSPTDFWDASHSRVVTNIGAFSDDVAIDSIAHPSLLARFNCGRPTVTSRGNLLSVEFPSFAPTPDQPVNDIAYNAMIAYANFIEAGPTLRTGTTFSAEYQALQSIWEDISLEPARLIRRVLDRGDYRELLTAEWTVGRGPLELFYRSQGHYLPAYPTSADRALIDRDWMNERQITSSTFFHLDTTWFTNPGMPGSFRPWKDWTRGDLNPNNREPMTHRPMAGILTQNAFLRSDSPNKARTLANRIFTTFTCQDVGNRTLTDPERSVHLPYVRSRESGGQHINPACIGCHINLDPLASALSTSFHDYTLSPEDRRSIPLPADPDLHYQYRGREHLREDANLVSRRSDVGGEFIHLQIGYNTYRSLFGVRGKFNYPATGALLGERVTGIVEVGRKLANSDEFARCAVKKAFEGIFGRSPGLSDARLISRVVDSFRGDDRYNYDRMIQRLVLSKGFQREN